MAALRPVICPDGENSPVLKQSLVPLGKQGVRFSVQFELQQRAAIIRNPRKNPRGIRIKINLN